MKHKNSHFNQIEIGPEDINRSSSSSLSFRYFGSQQHSNNNNNNNNHYGYQTIDNNNNHYMMDDESEDIVVRNITMKDHHSTNSNKLLNNNNNNNNTTSTTTTTTHRSRSSSLSSSPNVVPEINNSNNNPNNNNNNNNNSKVIFNNFEEKLLYIKKLLATQSFASKSSTTTTTTSSSTSNSAPVSKSNSPTTLSSPISNLMSVCYSSSFAMSPLSYDSLSRPISPVQIISPSLDSQSDTERNNIQSNLDSDDDDLAEYPSSVSTIQSYIRQLNMWISQIDRCSASARAIVWENYRVTCFTKAYPGVDPATLSICDIPFWSDKRTSKFRAHYNSIIRQPNPDYHSIKMLYVSFTDAIKNNSNLFEQCSPQTKTEEEENSFDFEYSDITSTNPFLLNANLFLSGSVWDCSFPAALQQLLYLLYWAPHLDKLPSNLRKMIWENCATYPPFKDLTTNIKLNNFTKVIKGWSNNPMHFMLAITTLFGSIGFLVEQKALKNEFTYPNSNQLVFSEMDNGSYSPQQPSTPVQPDQQIDVPELSQKKKKMKRSKSVDQSERVPSMSPISNKQTHSSSAGYLSPSSSFSTSDEIASDSEMNMSIDSTTSTSTTITSTSTSTNTNNSKCISSFDSISSMIDKAIKSSSKKPLPTPATNSSGNNITITPKKTQSATTRMRSTSLSSYSSNQNSFNIFGGLSNGSSPLTFTNFNNKSNSNNNTANNNNNTSSSSSAGNSKTMRGTLHLSSDSVPVNAGYSTPTTISDINAVSAVPVDGSSLDVLAMTAFQFEDLEEATNTNTNTNDSTPITKSHSQPSLVASGISNINIRNSDEELELHSPKKDCNKSAISFLSRKRRFSTELEEKQDATMNINNILCS